MSQRTIDVEPKKIQKDFLIIYKKYNKKDLLFWYDKYNSKYERVNNPFIKNIKNKKEE